MEAQEKLTQLKAQIALVRDLKITILCHKAKLRGLLRRPTREHVSGNTLLHETARVLWLIRKTTKYLREARFKLNQLYFELGGESGAKDLTCLTQKLKEESEESQIVKVAGYLSVKEVRTLMEAMLKFLYDRDSDSEKFGLEITGNVVTKELLVEPKEVI